MNNSNYTSLLANLKNRAKKLKIEIPAILLALKKKETPLGAKILAGLTIGYALSPIDLIPDFIPVLGYLDDLIILPALVSATIKLIPKDILLECQKEAENLGISKKQKKWYYAIPIAALWLIILLLIIRALLVK